MDKLEAGKPVIDRPDFTPRRGRPTQKQVFAIENAILAAARDLFLSDGYANASVEAVAARAGVSKGTLYARYATKVELFEAVAAERLRVWGEPGAARFDGDLRTRLIARGVMMLEASRSPEVRGFERLIMTESVRFPEISLAFYERGYKRNVDVIAAEVAEDTGAALRDAEQVARIFSASILGWQRTESMARIVSPEEAHAFVTKAVDILLSGRAAW